MVTGVIAGEACGSLHAGANAIGDANSTITISSHCKRGQGFRQMSDSVHPFQVPNRVLRHCGAPFVHASEKRLGDEREYLLQFFADDADYLFVRRLENLLVSRSAQKAANQSAV